MVQEDLLGANYRSKLEGVTVHHRAVDLLKQDIHWVLTRGCLKSENYWGYY